MKHPALYHFCDNYPQLGQRVYVDPSARVIGRVTLGDDVSIWPFSVLRGDVNTIDIGARTNIQDGCILHLTRPSDEHPQGYPLTLAEEITVGHRVTLHGCYIHSRVLVGMGAIIMDGVVVESNVMIGAGALVTPNTRLESGFLYLGSPAKKARALTENEKQTLEQSALNYTHLKEQYLKLSEPKGG